MSKMIIPDINIEFSITLKELTDFISVRHNDAMVKVDKLSEEPSFGWLRKTRSQYKSGKGRLESIDTYELTKKQAIAVGARLNNALLMKVIDRLEELEDKFHESLSPAQQLLKNAQMLVNIEERLLYQNARANRLENNIRRTLTDVEHFTVIGFANLKGIKSGTYHSPSIGKKCKKLSHDKGYVMGSVVDPKYGNIGTYHVDILTEVLKDFLE